MFINGFTETLKSRMHCVTEPGNKALQTITWLAGRTEFVAWFSEPLYRADHGDAGKMLSKTEMLLWDED